ncbi:FdhF/YdeP family oxidoreductase [Conexibacter sp. DBS9H8]|uniref:FdhF/YdeP family oxidoreductase n=1 Tax=Conexibacter sp. DBS9H8 TaxID=2937801 RepID=UPI00200CA719|nr:FdhF/YdeP family oxidoreductase [Conexibacter sp. DBS9H8]
MSRTPQGHDHGDDLPRRVSSPKHEAVGLAAVASSMQKGVAEMGVGRTARALLALNQRDGFDCPSCAWPDPAHRHTAEFCENGAKAVAEEATRSRATPDIFARYSIAEMLERSDHWIGKLGRLTQPLYVGPGESHYRAVSWEDALELVAERLRGLDAPDQAIFYTSGRTSNEAAFLYQAFVRALGTNNLPDCSNMCHESSGTALGQTIGIGKGSVSLEDLHVADLIVVAGQNPGTNHPRMLSALETAKRNGAKIVSINPLPEAGLIKFNNPQTARGMLGVGTALADLHLPIRVNGDLALFQAVNRELIRRGAVDRAFLDAHCSGYGALATHLEALDEATVAAATGLAPEQIAAFIELAAASQRTIVCWAMGLTQHKNSVPTIREVVNFLLLRGNIGRPGAGVCPVRGHSNVQGDRTMGIFERPPAALLDALETTLGFPMPREHGVDVVRAIRAMRDGEARVFMGMGGNFLSAAPDTAVTAAALRSCELTVHVATKPNRGHLVHGREGIILPTLGRTEIDRQGGVPQFVTVEDSMSAVHATRGTLEPASDQLRSEVRIVAELAALTVGDRGRVHWRALADDYGAIRELIAEAIPGFHDFNGRIADGFTLPHPPRDARRFETASGRAELTVNEITVIELPEDALLLQTLRSHDQYNTTIYALNDRYRGIHAGRRVVMVHPDDMAERGLAEGDVVDLVGVAEDGVERRASRFRVHAYPTARGCAAAYYPETNALVPLDSVADESGTPTSKSVVIRLLPSAVPAELSGGELARELHPELVGAGAPPLASA